MPGITGPKKLDDQVKDHLKKKGLNPHFRPEKFLYHSQSQIPQINWS